MKKLLITIMFLIAASLANAVVDVDFNFKDANGNMVNNVRTLAYNCLDSTCSVVEPFSGGFPDGKQTANGRLTIRFPSTLSSNGYAIFFASSGFSPKEGRATFHSNGDTSIFTTDFDISLNRISDCRSLVENVTILNVQTPNVPVIIDTRASLDALTHSAFALNNNEVAYVPEELKNEFYSADVRVTLVVRDSAGNVVDRQVTEFIGANSIFAEESKPVRFEFMPRTAGSFTATVTTDVIDNQCSSQQPQSSSKDFVVKSDLPKNECYTLLNGLSVDLQNTAESFSNERSFTLSGIDRSARSLTFAELGTSQTFQVALDNDFEGQLVTAGTVLKVTLEKDDFVRVDMQKQIRIPLGSTFSVFGEMSLSKQVNFNFNKLSNHVTNNPFSQATLTPVPTKIEVSLLDETGARVGSNNFTAGANPDTTNPSLVSLSFSTQSAGLHRLIAVGSAESSLCDGLNNSQERLTTEFFVRSPETFAVTFQVVDSITGEKIESADVLINGKTAQTTPQGIAVVAGLPSGNYGFSISHQKFFSQSGAVKIDSSDATVLISLQPLNATGASNNTNTDNSTNSTNNNQSNNQSGNQTNQQANQQQQNQEDEDDVESELKIESLRLPAISTVSAGSALPLFISVKNTGDTKLENIHLSATIPELGIRRRLGPFDVNIGERESRNMLLEIPDWTEDGEYVLRFELGNDDARRIVHRPIQVAQEEDEY
ncbi:MAG: hypothetical protein HY363_02455 [Candidatus Aenigmarchaeota archaeon]|nr:hypothetical protein [Candidatus Aenigmarchaeota archaeon]